MICWITDYVWMCVSGLNSFEKNVFWKGIFQISGARYSWPPVEIFRCKYFITLFFPVVGGRRRDWTVPGLTSVQSPRYFTGVRRSEYQKILNLQDLNVLFFVKDVKIKIRLTTAWEVASTFIIVSSAPPMTFMAFAERNLRHIGIVLTYLH